MKQNRSPWLPITMAIVGMVIGYAVVIFKNTEALAANGQQCPYHCQGDDCPLKKGQ